MYKCGNKLKLTSNVFRTLALHRRRRCGFVVFSTPPRALIPLGLGILSHICACACVCVSQLLRTSFANARRNGHQRGRRFNLYMTSTVANLGLIRQCKLQQVRHDRCHPVCWLDVWCYLWRGSSDAPSLQAHTFATMRCGAMATARHVACCGARIMDEFWAHTLLAD